MRSLAAPALLLATFTGAALAQCPPPRVIVVKPAAKPDASAKRKQAAAVENFGVELDKLHGGRRYAVNGREVSAAEARARLAPAGAAVPDDAARPRLTVIGPEAQRRAVRDDLARHPALAPWRDRLVVQDYAPDHWAVARAGFVTAGAPTIYLQSPAGAVLHRQDDYAGGAEALAAALRKADPDYRPERDLDRRRPEPAFPFPQQVPPGAWVLGAAALLVLLTPRGKP